MSEGDDEGKTEDGKSQTQMPLFPGAGLTRALQGAGEEALEQQAEMFDLFLRNAGSERRGEGGFADRLTGFGTDVGAFKARVQTGGRVSIPDTEREALGIGEEDLVQVFVVPVESERGEQR